MILVTGGAGFIGSNAIKTLNKSGVDDIIICDHLGKSTKWKNLIDLNFKDYLEKDDLFDFLSNSNPNLEAIIHLGACSDTTEKDASYLLKNNYEYSKELCKYALKNNIRFIYASSAATYGDGELGYDDEHDNFKNLKPLNMYGYSKQLFDLWILKNNYQDKVVGLKYFNVFGPAEYHKGKMSSMIYKAFYQIKETGSLKLFKSYNDKYADGEQLRDFIYVNDAVKMTLSFLHNDASGIYNIGSGKTSSWNQLARAVFSAMNVKEQIEYIDMPGDLIKQYQYYTKANLSKFIKSQKFETSYNLDDAVKDYINNYLSQL